jgi:hypothetical protein
MANYSTNLRLTLLDTGEGAGTWGNTTNTNMGTLLEQAISGYDVQTLTSGTTLTLTIPNDGASAVARNMYLEFTGDGSTVIVPSNKKLYFVYNNCTSGTVTMKVAGQTGVTVDKGDRVILVSDGTDIVEATSYSTGIGTSLTLTTLTAASANITTLTAASANITTLTGTNAAFTSLTLTNALGVAEGGTGLDTTPTNGQLPIGNGSGFSFSTLTAGTGITITNGAGSITISTSSNLTGVTTAALTALGLSAGGNLSGTNNSAFGNEALKGVSGSSTGNNNTGVGNNALLALTTGSSNTAVGHVAGDSITSGPFNVCVGSFAGTAITSGGSNTCLGYFAGNGITTGGTNVAVGDAAYGSGNYSNSACFGYNSSVTGSNQVQLGDSSTTTYAYGAVQDRSDARDKTDIRDTELGLNFIMALRPRDFKWDMREDYRTPFPTEPDPLNYPDEAAYQAAISQWKIDYANWGEANKLANITHNGTHTRTRYHQGLIAQEVKQTMDELGVDFGGYQDHSIKGGDAVLTIGYEELVAPLIKAIQELKAEFDEYKSTHP